MFTGIVEELGRLEERRGDERAQTLTFAAEEVLGDVRVGDSIAVEGCCLTVTRVGAGRFEADLMAETLRATTLGGLAVGDPVNLERAMAASTRFGGHLVQGHVDGVGEVVDIQSLPGTVFLSLRVPSDLLAYLVPKGSVTLSGVSLTVVDVTADVIRTGLIPHTLAVTSLGGLAVGDHLNIEVDVIAKYVERLLAGGTHTPYKPEPGDPGHEGTP